MKVERQGVRSGAEGDGAAHGETVDAFLGGQLMIRQPEEGYRAGLDAVLLAASVGDSRGAGGRLVDLGSGVGVVALAAARRLEGLEAIGIELAPRLVAMARANAEANQLASRVGFVTGDVLEAGIAGRGLLEGSRFSVVTINPPFHESASMRLPKAPLRSLAHAMPMADLAGWIEAAARLTERGGELIVVHRAAALGALLSALEGRFGGIEVLALHPRRGAPAKRVLVRARRASRAPLQLLDGVALHVDEGGFAPHIDDVLRHGVAMEWA
ncbi:MAG: methyltransferase [Rhizobiales bacterium]|nr:methyltransferase [Hyphomicrobiales bacterium]